MRRRLVLTFAAAGLAAGLAACGKSSTRTNEAAQAPAGQAAAPAPELTAAEKKAALAALPAPYNAADLANGKAKFALCASCHTIAAGGPNLTGPNLHGVFGRKAGSLANYNYSDSVKNAGFAWDAAQLDKWVSGPRADLPGTKMTFAGIKDPKDRADLVAYVLVEGGPASR